MCRRGSWFHTTHWIRSGDFTEKPPPNFFLGRQCGKPWFSQSYSVYCIYYTFLLHIIIYIYIYYTLYIYIYITQYIYIYIYYTLYIYILHFFFLYNITSYLIYIYDMIFLLLESTISIMFHGELPILPWILSRSRRDRLRMLSDHEPCRPVGLGWAWQFGY